MSDLERRTRESLVRLAESLHARGLTPGSSGNVSVRVDAGFVVTPTGSVLGRLDADRLSRLDAAGTCVDGPAPTKEVPLHLAVYRARPEVQAVVHLHSPYAMALSTLADVDPRDVLPPLTAYYAMRVVRLPLAPFVPPGDPRLADVVAPLLADTAAVLLANHGPLAGAASLDAAADVVEEIEHTARLWFTVSGHRTRPLTPDQVEAVRSPRAGARK